MSICLQEEETPQGVLIQVQTCHSYENSRLIVPNEVFGLFEGREETVEVGVAARQALNLGYEPIQGTHPVKYRMTLIRYTAGNQTKSRKSDSIMRSVKKPSWLNHMSHKHDENSISDKYVLVNSM